jgi:hypothetical protein
MIQPQLYPVHHPQPHQRMPIIHAQVLHRLAPITKAKPNQSIKSSKVFYKDHKHQPDNRYIRPRKSQFDLLI